MVSCQLSVVSCQWSVVSRPVIARSLRRSTAKQRRKPISRVSGKSSDTLLGARWASPLSLLVENPDSSGRWRLGSVAPAHTSTGLSMSGDEIRWLVSTIHLCPLSKRSSIIFSQKRRKFTISNIFGVRWRFRTGYICPPFSRRKWRNWQTHHLEGVAPKGVRVQVPPSAQKRRVSKQAHPAF